MGLILTRAQEAPTGSNKLDKQDQGHTSEELQAENTRFKSLMARFTSE